MMPCDIFVNNFIRELSEVELLYLHGTSSILFLILCDTLADRPGRRKVIAIGTTAPLVCLFSQHSNSCEISILLSFPHVTQCMFGFTVDFHIGMRNNHE